MRFILMLLLHFICIITACAQRTDSLHIEIGSMATLASQEYQPLWLVANRWGTIADWKGDASTHLRLSNYHRWGSRDSISSSKTRKTFDHHKKKARALYLTYGLDLYNNQHFDDFFLEEAYLKIGYGPWELRGGRYEEVIGEGDPELSSGSLSLSSNALPIPKIGIAVTEYTDVPFTQGWLQFKGQFSHGWMGSNRVVSHTYLHQKDLYLKLGKEQLSIYTGLTHFALWGGEHPRLGTLPQSFTDYIRVALIIKGGEDAPITEAMNKLGNHLGMTDIGLRFRWKAWHGTLYYQTPYEDRSGFLPSRNPDHLAGISIRKKHGLLNAITLEYMDTRKQSGSVHPPGLDNYYNNGLYGTGWVYQGNTLGTPLFLTRSRGQQYFGEEVSSSSWNVINNRIHGFHMGVSGNFTAHLQYRTLLTYTQNYGNYYNDALFQPYKKQVYFLQELVYTQDRWTLSAALGVDRGSLTDNTGGALGISYDLSDALKKNKHNSFTRE
ncbi:capsule assembly Wzi family protein [Catalinimonas niigatensis]|uniref:capsule assembly Wzi family protein n=1 Tax=Catalinimonas niigatensis TaxID=1397264 RepID=UPI0026656A4A|nr:capsule assembly Wzi family protein [Catalinimonas niigatensis]WPP52924.1 capsule assembly Wzi family protein [Catalinimonas niigatensis]